MKQVLLIIGVVGLLCSCNSKHKYEQLAEEFLRTIPLENVVATFPDADKHCVFYIEEGDLGYLTEAGDKYDNLIRYDLKTKKRLKLLRDDNGKLNDYLDSLDHGSGFITISYHDFNSGFIFIASHIDEGYYDLALYDIKKNRWNYLDDFPIREILMTEEEIRCRGTEIIFSQQDWFGNLEWVKVFDMKGHCLDNTVYDNQAHRTYDGYRLFEQDDEEYITQMVTENFQAFMEANTVSLDELLDELSINQLQFDAKYKNRYLLFFTGEIMNVRSASLAVLAPRFYDYEQDYKYCIEPTFYDVYCFSNDPEVLSLSAGDSTILYGEYAYSNGYDITMINCRVFDDELAGEFFNYYIQELRRQKGWI